MPPSPEAVKRKDDWIQDIKREIQADWQPTMVKVTYKLHNPEVDQQRKFFNGPVVEYWLIQMTDKLEGRPDRKELDRAREQILTEMLGYQVELLDGVKQWRRSSTSEMTEVQEWHDFLEEMKETLFDANGFDFPESEKFWKMAEEIGYEKAKDAAIEHLQKKLVAKHTSPQQ